MCCHRVNLMFVLNCFRRLLLPTLLMISSMNLTKSQIPKPTDLFMWSTWLFRTPGMNDFAMSHNGRCEFDDQVRQVCCPIRFNSITKHKVTKYSINLFADNTTHVSHMSPERRDPRNSSPLVISVPFHLYPVHILEWPILLRKMHWLVRSLRILLGINMKYVDTFCSLVIRIVGLTELIWIGEMLPQLQLISRGFKTYAHFK